MEQFINEIEENEQEERAGFVIDNDQKADWAVRRIAELEADTQKWKDYYKAQSERVAQSNQQSIDFEVGADAPFPGCEEEVGRIVDHDTGEVTPIKGKRKSKVA